MRTTLRAHRDLTPASEPGVGTTDEASQRDRPSWRVTGGRPVLAAAECPTAGWYLASIDFDGVHDPARIDEPEGLAPPIALRFLPESGTVPLARRPVPLVSGRRARVVHVPGGSAHVQLEVSPWLQTVSSAGLNFLPLPDAAAAAIMSADVAASGALGSTDGRALVRDLRTARASKGVRGSIEQIAIAYEQLQHRRAGDSVDYPSWRLRNAVVFDDDAERLRKRVDVLPDGGSSFSVVVPVFDTDERWLRAAIESVTGQIYDGWELILVDDASTAPHVAQTLGEYEATDQRIRVHTRTENGHIAAATNDGLSLASGDFVVFMDHDDELAPFALAVVALAIEEAGGEVDLLYTDEDKIDSSGRHFDPHCKPRWNPELLLGQNYMSHLTAIRRSVVSEVGGLRPGFDGAQDHDLLLRATARIDPSRIVHVPFVAYHWRAVQGSTAMAAGEKDYTEEASVAALRDRLGPDWVVNTADAPTTYRCTPPLADYPLVSIIVPTRDRIDLLRQCVESLSATTYPAFEIIIVDNDSIEPETLAWLEAFDNGHDHQVLRYPGPFNYSAVNNFAAGQARGDLLCLLNNDTEVIEPGWLDEMVRWVLQPGVGAVGAMLLYGDDSIQHAGVVLGLGGLAGHGHHLLGRNEFGYFNRLTITHEVGAVTGACLLTRRSTWEQLDGLDEDLAVAFNDVDYCLRVRHTAGQRILWTPNAVLYHHESQSRGAEDDPAKVARFNAEVDRVMERWSDHLADDPAYSLNLSLEANSFTLARSPRVTPPWS